MFATPALGWKTDWAARWSWSMLLLGACSSAEPVSPALAVPAPADSPGVTLNGLERACPNSGDSFGQCMAWSSDGLTLFVVLRTLTDTVLVSVDIPPASPPPLLGAFRVIGSVGRVASLAASQDPRAIFFTRSDAIEPSHSAVMRMSLNDGTTTKVASAGKTDISVTPDGSGVAYHAFGGSVVNALSGAVVDTVVLIDVPSGMRRAQTVSLVPASLRGISPDGRDVALTFYGDSAVIWHSATGVRERVKDGGIATGIGIRYLADVQWSSGGFSTLYKAETGELTEVSASTGAVTNYAPHTAFTGSVVWSPAVSRVFTADVKGPCYPNPKNCTAAVWHSDLVITSLSGVRTIGSVNSQSQGARFAQFFPSPDGRWLAYYATEGRLYLVAAGF
jgi:hypothetical protein